MVDSGARLLSLANQLQYDGNTVTLSFDEGYDGTQGYLDRMGFFKLLHSRIDVVPYLPFTSMADVYRGENPNLVEFRAIRPSHRDRGIPSCLADALVQAVTERPIRETLGNMTYTVFSELIDNIYEHSVTALDGYV